MPTRTYSRSTFLDLQIVVPKPPMMPMAITTRSRPYIFTNVSKSNKSATQETGQSYYSPTDLTSPFITEDEQEDELVVAMHDFVPVTPTATCLSFRAGQVIRVLNKDPTGWWDGELVGGNSNPDVVARGWFPSNYVSTDTAMLVKEVLPMRDSVTSWATMNTSTSVPPSSPIMSSTSTAATSPLSTMDDVPTVLQPLLQGLTLIQTAVQHSRSSHYQPSAACIISCVRAVLTDANCLQKDSPLLRIHADLAQARKFLLADLAELVQHAQRAAALAKVDEDWEDIGVAEDELLESMLQTAGSVFTATRRFLSLLEECGVRVSSWPRARGRSLASSDSSSGHGSGSDLSSGHQRLSSSGSESSDSQRRLTMDEPRHDLMATPQSNSANLQRGYAIGSPSQDDITVSNTTSRRELAYSRARSMNDLRKAKTMQRPNGTTSHHTRYPISQSVDSTGSSTASLLPKMEQPLSQPRTSESIERQPKRRSMSVSTSISSASSYATPPTPPFPSGPCTSDQVLSTLRTSQDHLLSTVAAFIGHVHGHSRRAHSTSKGHVIHLATETVERVKNILALIDAILKHPEVLRCVPKAKIASLGSSKNSLFYVTNDLVDYVKTMTAPSPEGDEDEEEEKNKTLNAATGVLRAARESSNAVNLCLSRPVGEPPFIIILPDFSSSSQNGEISQQREAGSLDALPEQEVADQVEEEEELNADVTETILDGQESEEVTLKQENPLKRVDSLTSASLSQKLSVSTEEVEEVPEESLLSFDGSEVDEDTEEESASPTPSGDEQQSPIVVNPPAASVAHSDEDAHTWESVSSTATRSLEEKILHGELPSVPASPPPPSTIESAAPSSASIFQQYAEREADPRDIVFNTEGLIIGATLKVLVEKMTPHDVIVDTSFSSVFFLTFRFFAPPDELLDELISRFSLWPSESLSQEELQIWSRTQGFAIRIRVSNFIKLWLEMYWRPESDNAILPRLLDFVGSEMAANFSGPATRIQELIRIRMRGLEDSRRQPADALLNKIKSTDRLREIGSPVSPVSPSDIPRPQITKSLFNLLRHADYSSINVMDFDPLELARQLTIHENNLYRAVLPEEILEIGRSGAPPAVNVKAISTLSTAITGWVTESILSEQDIKKRASLLKFFIKVADRCSRLNNFSTPRSILAALDSATISRLQQTWAAVPQKQRVQFEDLRKLADHGRNYAEYRSRLRNTAAPAVPFLGLYLTDITFCREGNPSFRSPPSAPNHQLINFNKYHKLARIVQDMQRFQIPYTLKEISEVQQYLAYLLNVSKNPGDLQDLYRRSLIVEPRRPADVPPSGEVRQLFGWASRSSANHPQQQTGSTGSSTTA